MSPELWILGLRLAGAFHLVTLTLACFTPIPPDWDKNLAALPPIHRRFALAQNFSIGATIAALGLVSILFARHLITGEPLARVLCALTALFWGGPLLILPLLRLGYALLLTQCAIYATAYGWLALHETPRTHSPACLSR